MLVDMLIDNIPHTGTAVNTANATSVAVIAVSWTNWLPPILSALATLMTIIWMGIQMTVVIKAYLDKRELARGPRGKQGIQGEKGPASPTVIPVIIKPEDLK